MQPPAPTWPRRLWGLLAGGALLGTALGLGFGVVTVPGYDASAFLLVTPAGQTPLQTSEVQYAQALSQVVTNPSVLGAAGTRASVAVDPDDVRADASPNAPLIEITVNAASADVARRQTQAAAEAVVAYTQDRVDLLGFRTVLLAPATAGQPAGLSLPAYLAVGAVLGAVLAGLFAMIRGDGRRTASEPWPVSPQQQARQAQPPALATPPTARTS